MEQAAVKNSGIKRRGRTKQERRAIVEETARPGATVTAVARAHGLRPNQVFHWRRLYQQGLLDNEAAATALVPVRISEAGKAPSAARLISRSASACNTAASGVIQVELKRARLSVHGAADAESLQTVLEFLLR